MEWRARWFYGAVEILRTILVGWPQDDGALFWLLSRGSSLFCGGDESGETRVSVK